MHARTAATSTNADRTSIVTRRVSAALALAVAILIPTIVAAPTAGAAQRPSTHPRATWAPELDRQIVPTRTKAHGRQLATWYGPGLFGNGTACGQTLQPETWGIAHRTLPCGTLVKLSHRGRSVTVRVIDRGPFSGATVDLTSRTKYYLNFASGHVKMTEVKRYRVLPEPNRRVVGTFGSRG
jgi:rare lipoprotein A (peptidoglycan hydrolase)